MKINIIMPTYNDSESIIETLDSLIIQTYKKWHLTIVNDGSSDNTEDVIKKYIKKNKLEDYITYIYQKNADQLNAIKTALNNIEDKDGLIYVLHSDDLMNDEYVFENAVSYFSKNDADAIISNYNLIDENSNVIGYQKVKKYNKKESTMALQGLWLGRNLFVDVAFWKNDVYRNQVLENYLNWNTPFWIDHRDFSMLDVHNVNFSFFKYRTFEGNYINNEIGMLNVLNGELRNEINILKHINIPFYKIQYFLFRALNKLGLQYKVIYNKKQQKNIYNILKFTITKRISTVNIQKYPYYEAILNFFKNINAEKTIELFNVEDDSVFLGADVRSFNKRMLSKTLPKLYYDLFDYMNFGFNKIITDEKSYNNVEKIVRFLDIDKFVDIIITK